MSRHVIFTPATAVPATRETLLAIEETVGFLPNVFAILGDAPHILDALVAINTQFAEGQLTATEREIVQLAVSAQNGCRYCVSGHTAFATDLGYPPDQIVAMRENRPLRNSRHEALRRFAQALAATKGQGADAEYETFLQAGYTTQDVRDVILGVTTKMFTNMLAILLDVPLDDRFKPYAWSPESTVPATDAA